ncbi:MAG: halo transducer protein [Haloferacaceae archaeon]
MTDEQGSDAAGVLGLSVDEAVAAVAAASEDRDPERVRAVLGIVAEDGVVTRDGIRSAVADLSVPEDRIGRAERALADARQAARPADRFDVVRDRLAAFESRLDALRADAERMAADVRDLADRAEAPDSAYGVAVDIRRLAGETDALGRATDDLALDAERFERWLADPERRRRELAGDADAMAGFLDGLADATDDLADAVAAAGSDLPDPAGHWVDATARARVSALLIADLRADLAALREWPGAEADDGALGDLADRIDGLDARRDRIADRLADLSRPAWRERHADRLAAVERVLDGFEPPVDWEEVQAALDDHRLGIGTG